MTSKNVKRILILSPLLVIAVASLYWYNPNLINFSMMSATKSQIVDLGEFALLRATFESDSGYIRLITQLSPT